MADENKYNIKIECGTDFVLPFVWTDDNGNPVDLTGATVSAQLREYSGDPDAIDFICTHNNAGGRIMLVMPNELTRQITYSYGVYDVTVVLGSGVTKRPLYGEVKVQDEVTKPLDGEMLYTIAIESYDKLPTHGLTNRLYYVYAEQMILRWNGTNYVSALEQMTLHNEGAWDEDIAYQKFATVTNAGSSYLALQNVPVGIDIHNTTYWLKLADAGGAVNINDNAGEGDTTLAWSADKNIREKNDVLNTISKIHNIPGSIDNSVKNYILDCIYSYLDHGTEFFYGQYEGWENVERITSDDIGIDGATVDDIGRMKIVCSSFTYLVSRGIDYNSSYYAQENIVDNVGTLINEENKQFYPYGYHYENEEDYYVPGRKRIPSFNTAKYFDEHGLLYEIEGNNIDLYCQFGDILFLKNATNPNFYLGINHCAIYLYTDHNGNPVVAEVIEDFGETGPFHISTIYRGSTRYNQIKYGARPPYIMGKTKESNSVLLYANNKDINIVNETVNKFSELMLRPELFRPHRFYTVSICLTMDENQEDTYVALFPLNATGIGKYAYPCNPSNDDIYSFTFYTTNSLYDTISATHMLFFRPLKNQAIEVNIINTTIKWISAYEGVNSIKEPEGYYGKEYYDVTSEAEFDNALISSLSRMSKHSNRFVCIRGLNISDTSSPLRNIWLCLLGKYDQGLGAALIYSHNTNDVLIVRIVSNVVVSKNKISSTPLSS